MHPPRRAALRRGLVLASAVGAAALAGCVPGLPGQGPGPRIFRLTPKTTFPPGLPAVAWTLAVAEPAAERALDTNRIAVVTEGTGVDYVAEANWIERAPAMLQTLLVQSFRISQRIAAVGTDRDRLRAEYLLRTDLLAFQLNRTAAGGGTPAVRIRLDPTLARLPRREIVGSDSFARDAAPAGPGVEAAIAAFDEALGGVLKDIVLWTLRTGQQGTAA